MPSEYQQDIDQLARLTLEHKHGERVYSHEALQGVVGAVTWDDPELREELGLPGADTVTADDALAGLRLLADERSQLNLAERRLTEAAKDRGATWEQIGAVSSRSAQAAQQRYKRLGGTRNWPTSPPRRARS